MAILSVSNSTIKVMNAALAELGVPPISSFTENSISARTGNAKFLDTLEGAISAYRWRFAQEVFTLQQSGDVQLPPDFHSAWRIPREAVAVHVAYANGRRVRWDVLGEDVIIEWPSQTTPAVTVEASAVKAPEGWPGHFRRYFIPLLAAELAMPITQDESRAVGLFQLAEQRFALAKSRDAQSRSPRRIDTGAFVRARRGGR
ncbi:hypothetical protein [Mangrovicoccus algicola]|uniref:Uncharacterized protein n=1 Tax=Mangrovicoccus algicola TaxID=2771008 RepID=A0A8J6YTR1_9RHOB|nr:hypothetical protein [Mangrovicoccus algicola]MBE3637357.1 hypothetical protein [Mangrovicoccus algicola]